jgi:hypothetical protein
MKKSALKANVAAAGCRSTCNLFISSDWAFDQDNVWLDLQFESDFDSGRVQR